MADEFFLRTAVLPMTVTGRRLRAGKRSIIRCTHKRACVERTSFKQDSQPALLNFVTAPGEE
jgi:hypothetical protein